MTNAGKRMDHDHHFIDDCFTAFADAATQGRIARFPLEEAIRRLRRHFWVEEEFIFPALLPTHPGPVMVMLRQHGLIWDHVEELEALHADGNLAPELALTIYSALRQEMDRHNATEDDLLYAVMDDNLGQDLAHVVLDALATEMPSAWRCAMASVQV